MLDAPVTLSLMGLGAFPASNEAFTGMIGCLLYTSFIINKYEETNRKTAGLRIKRIARVGTIDSISHLLKDVYKRQDIHHN